MIQTDQILKERHSYVAVTNSKTETPAQNHLKLFLFLKTENFTCVLQPFISSCIWNDILAGCHSINEEFDSVPNHTSSSHHTSQYPLPTVSFDAENGTVKSLNLQFAPKKTCSTLIFHDLMCIAWQSVMYVDRFATILAPLLPNLPWGSTEKLRKILDSRCYSFYSNRIS